MIIGHQPLFPKGLFSEPDSFPPFDLQYRYFFFLREPQDDRIALILENGDSYDLEPRILERYLGMYRLPEDFLWGLMAYIWNFGSVLFDRTLERYERIPMEELVDETTGRIKSPTVCKA